jgi:membrane protein required for beta-lactamase induction
MRLIAILLALWANRHPRHVDRWRNPAPFLQYLQWIRTRVPARSSNEGLLQLALALLPPVLLFALLQAWLDGWLFGLAEIALGAWALLFLQGAGRPDDQRQAFVEAGREGRLDSARSYAAPLAGLQAPSSSASQLPMLAAEGLLWQAYRRLLGGIFWLLIVGPVGPVAVRLAALARESSLFRDDSFAHYSEQLLKLIDWLPARATALSFALAGSFVHARDGWLRSQHLSDDPQRLITAAGIGALDIDDAPEELFDAENDDAEDLLKDTQELIGRSLMIWLGAAALLTIAGWLH